MLMSQDESRQAAGRRLRGFEEKGDKRTVETYLQIYGTIKGSETADKVLSNWRLPDEYIKQFGNVIAEYPNLPLSKELSKFLDLKPFTEAPVANNAIANCDKLKELCIENPKLASCITNMLLSPNSGERDGANSFLEQNAKTSQFLKSMYADPARETLFLSLLAVSPKHPDGLSALCDIFSSPEKAVAAKALTDILLNPDAEKRDLLKLSLARFNIDTYGARAQTVLGLNMLNYETHSKFAQHLLTDGSESSYVFLMHQYRPIGDKIAELFNSDNEQDRICAARITGLASYSNKDLKHNWLVLTLRSEEGFSRAKKLSESIEEPALISSILRRQFDYDRQVQSGARLAAAFIEQPDKEEAALSAKAMFRNDETFSDFSNERWSQCEGYLKQLGNPGTYVQTKKIFEIARGDIDALSNMYQIIGSGKNESMKDQILQISETPTQRDAVRGLMKSTGHDGVKRFLDLKNQSSLKSEFSTAIDWLSKPDNTIERFWADKIFNAPKEQLGDALAVLKSGSQLSKLSTLLTSKHGARMELRELKELLEILNDKRLQNEATALSNLLRGNRAQDISFVKDLATDLSRGNRNQAYARLRSYSEATRDSLQTLA